MRADPRPARKSPLVWDADAGAAHAHNVLDVLVVALNPHAGKDQRAFGILVDRRGIVARRDAVADVGHVSFGARGKQVLAFEKDRHHEGMVGGVGIAAIGIVVEVGVAFANVAGMKLRHAGALQMAAEDMHRQPLGRCQQAVIAGDNAAREIACAGNHRRARRLEQRIGHFPDDAVQPVGDDRGLHRIKGVGLRLLCHGLVLIVQPGVSVRSFRRR